MAPSRLAHHFPALFGPSRRAAWRLSVARRALAAVALLLALHVATTSSRGPLTPAPTHSQPPGPALSLPLALPADHLVPGEEVAVYLPGTGEPLVTGARFGGSAESMSGSDVARITLRGNEVAEILENLRNSAGEPVGFVLVGTG